MRWRWRVGTRSWPLMSCCWRWGEEPGGLRPDPAVAQEAGPAAVGQLDRADRPTAELHAVALAEHQHELLAGRHDGLQRLDLDAQALGDAGRHLLGRVVPPVL